MDAAKKEKKFERTTKVQLECYIAFLKQHPEMINGKNTPAHPRQIEQLWKQVAGRLNALEGATRNAKKWKESLANWKKQLRCRARKAKAERALTVGESAPSDVDEFELQALETLGMAAVGGIPAAALGFEVRLDNKVTLKPQKKLFKILVKEPQIKSAVQQIDGISSTSRKAKAMYEMKVQNMNTNDDDLCRDPISIPTMSPDRDIKPEILHEYEETQPSPNHTIFMEHITSDSNTMGDSVRKVEEDKVITEDISNSPLATRTHEDHSNDNDDWEEHMKRKKLQLELEYLELKNYKIKLELYEMEQKLKLNPSKYTADITCRQLPNTDCA